MVRLHHLAVHSPVDNPGETRKGPQSLTLAAPPSSLLGKRSSLRVLSPAASSKLKVPKENAGVEGQPATHPPTEGSGTHVGCGQVWGLSQGRSQGSEGSRLKGREWDSLVVVV